MANIFNAFYLLDGRKTSGSSSSRHGTGSTGSGSGSTSKSSAPIDYSRYVKRFGSAAECGSPYCKDLNYRFVLLLLLLVVAAGGEKKENFEVK